MRTDFANLHVKHGTQPIFLLKIYWTRNTVRYYSDADDYDAFEPKLLSIGNISYAVTTNKSGDSSSVSITLDDTDGTIKQILNTSDAHKAAIRIYQGFKDIPFYSLEDSAILLFRGEINTPVIWRESDRTISFDVVSPVENWQLGFSVDQSYFDNLSADTASSTWPLGYGEVVKQECPSITSRLQGESTTEFQQLTLSQLEDIDTAYNDYYEAKLAYDATVADPDITNRPSQDDFAKLIEDLSRKEQYLIELERNIEYKSQLTNNADYINYVQLNREILVLKREYYDKQLRSDAITIELNSLNKILDNTSSKIDDTTRAALTAKKDALTTELNDIAERLTDINNSLQTKSVSRRLKLKIILNFTLSTIGLKDGHPFDTSGATIFILVNGLKLEGYISAANKNIFNVVAPHPTYSDLEIENIPGSSDYYKYNNAFKLVDGSPNIQGQYCLLQEGTTKFIVYVGKQIGSYCFYGPQLFKLAANGFDLVTRRITDEVSLLQTSPIILPNWLDYFQTFPEPESAISGFGRLPQVDYAISAGDTVYLYQENFSYVHIVNCVPKYYAYSNVVPTGDSATVALSSGAYIEGVYAYKNINNNKILVRVDPAYYTLFVNQTLNDVVITYLKLSARLSELDESYDDTIYVSYKSGAAGGSQNTSDILKHLILCFTYNPEGYNVDNSSFGSVKTLLTKYPMNFSLTYRSNTLDIINDLAYQNRCAVVWFNEVAYLKYLPYFASLLTITQDYVLSNSLEISYESTDDLITEHVATWRRSEIQDVPFESKVRFNVNKYGKSTETVDYFAIKHEETIAKSLTFWAIQKACTYKILTFKGPLNLLRLMPFDQVTITTEANVIGSSTSTKGEVMSISYDPQTLLVTVQIKTAIRAGEMEEYPFRWPYDSVLTWPYGVDLSYIGGNKAGLEGPITFEDFSLNIARANDYGSATLGDAADDVLESILADASTSYVPVAPPVSDKPAGLVLYSEQTFIANSNGRMARLDTLLEPVKVAPNTALTNPSSEPKKSALALKSNYLIVGSDLAGNETYGSNLELRLRSDKLWEDFRMPFVAKILGTWGLIDGKIGAYKYEWQEYYVGPDVSGTIPGSVRAGSGATSSFAINLCEFPNVSPGRFGNGVTYNSSLKIEGTNLTFQPIPANTLVIMLPVFYYEGSTRKIVYAFAVPNGTDGECT